MAVNHRAGKLAVLLHADVAGSTSLVQQDEHLAHERIQATFRRFGNTIVRYRGRVRELRGDALLAEFERSSDAVKAALAFQVDHAEQNTRLDDAIRPMVRVGIAMGEVVVADRTVTGAGVVLAQRMEQLAEPGGVCITAAIHESLPQRLPFAQTDLGERRVKGFNEPVRVYGVRVQEGVEPPEPGELYRQRQTPIVRWVSTAAIAILVCGSAVLAWYQPWVPTTERTSLEAQPLALPDKPSIAVLPFINMSDDPDQDYFADGITEDLTTDLSKISGLFVIARNSAFTYKGRAVKPQVVAQELGVRYVLEGSVRRVGNQVRINAQLVDAETEGHIWADRYDGNMAQVFGLQDNVTASIVSALALTLTDHEFEQIRNATTRNPEAYDAYLQGWTYFRSFTKEDFAKAESYLLRAVKIDPDYARAHAALAAVYWHSILRAWRGDLGWPDAHARALQHLDLALKNPTPLAHRLESRILLHEGQHDAAIAAVQRAIALDPNDADNFAMLGHQLTFAGRPEEAVDALRKAMRLDPVYPATYLQHLGRAYFGMERYQDAVDTLTRARKRNPGLDAWMLVAAYGQLNQIEAAKETLASYLEYRGWRTWREVKHILPYFPYKNAIDRERFARGLVSGGMCCADQVTLGRSDLPDLQR